MSENNWSYGYTVYRFAFEIAKAEGTALTSMKRAQYLELIRDVAIAINAGQSQDSPGPSLSPELRSTRR